MTDCPNCGEPVDDGYCWSCGSDVDGAAGDDSGSDHTGLSAAEQSPADDAADSHARTAGGDGPESGSAVPKQPSSTETDRRNLLRYGAVGAALVGGWYVFVRDSSSDPEAVVADYYSAIDARDVDAANALIHEDASDGELTESDLENAGEYTVTVESTVERSVDVDDETVVEAETRVDEEGEEPETVRWELILRKQDGEWRIYDLSFDGRVD